MRIQNFKAWEDTGELRMAPITVFFGRNSSGKTSLLQFLLMLKQTAQSPDRSRALHLGDKTSLVELGTYKDVVSAHDERRKMQFELAWDLPEMLRIEDSVSGLTYEGNALGFGATVTPAVQGRLLVEWLEYRLLGEHGVSMAVGMSADADDPLAYHLTEQGYRFERHRGRARVDPPLRFYSFPEQVVARHKNASFVSDLALQLELLLGKLYHLGPLRQRAERMYVWSGTAPDQTGREGQNTVDALLSGRGRRFRRRGESRHRSLESTAARWLKAFGLIDSFRIRQLAPNRREYEVLVRVQPGTEEVPISDVGFGVAQVLPVVVACFHAPRGSILLLEQPEIHLHPSAQAALADLIIDAAFAQEDATDRGIQVIVESHSEHFLHRLQRRIAEEELRHDQVAAYFCDQVAGASRAVPLEVDEFGNITNWPQDFFGDDMGDLVAMTEAAARRHGL